jgi:hypothetical protein
MPKFESRRVESIKARELVEQLFIDGVGQLDSFEASLKRTTYVPEFPTILRYIQHFADGNSVGARMKYLKNVKDGVTEYEFITKHLRVYAIQQPGKKIIIYGGVKAKADSSDNIASFRSIKKEYLSSQKLQKHEKGRINKR